MVSQEELVTDLTATARRLQRSLGLAVRELVPPQPLDPGRLDEWRSLLTADERRLLLAMRRRPALAAGAVDRHAAVER